MNQRELQRTVVVTGASSGIGKTAARMFAERGWRVIAVGRDPARSEAALAEIRDAAPTATVDFLRGDFDLMAEVRRVAGEIARLTPRVDVLINNAGGVRDRMIVTSEGNEATFAANHLAPFLLTRELMPLLEAAAADSPPGAVRVIAVSSSGHERSARFDWDDLQALNGFTTARAYCQAKLANILFTRELARRVAGDGIIAHCMHPGRVDSNFANHGDDAMKAYFATADLTSPDEPAETLIWLATTPEVGTDSGRYFHRCEEVAPAAHALDDEAARRLWEESEKLLARRRTVSPQASATQSFEPLARGFYLEGLLVDGDDIWFTDVITGGVRRVGSSQVLLESRTMIGGLLLNADGSLLVAGVGNIAWANPRTGASGALVGGFEGVNEMRPDGHGGMIFGTIDLPAILRGERPGSSSIYRLSANRDLTLLREGLAFANGLALSPDGSTLFFNESFAAVRAFPRRGDGSLGEPRLLIEKRDCDGMALDAEGNIWISGFSSSELLCLRADGSEVRRMRLPGKACTNVRFGGADMRDLYVTIVDPASAQALADGRPLKEQNSVLYRTRSPVPGAPIARTSFKLS